MIPDDLTNSTPPQFPTYQPPKTGVPLIPHPKQAAPLMKMMRQMMKPKTAKRIFSPRPKRSRKKDQVKFY